MICTCTMNPSLDYYMEFEKNPVDQKVTRSQMEYYEAGGKGINISIVLNNLGVPTRAFGFVGGFTKDFYVSLLAKYEHIRPNFTYTNGHTRINVKLRMPDTATDLNAYGPIITHESMQDLKKKVSGLYEQDYFVLAGVTPEYLTQDTEEMLKGLIEEGLKVVLDTNPEIMRDMIGAKPFLYKTTPAELSQITGEELHTSEEVIKAAASLHEQGVMNVMVLLDNTNAVLVCAQGTYTCHILNQGAAVNTVGTGDSLVAGFLMDYMRNRDAADAFRFGASCGSATAYSKSLATREKIDAVYEHTEIKKIA